MNKMFQIDGDCIMPIIANLRCVKYQWYYICLHVGFFCCGCKGFYGFPHNFSPLTLISFKVYVFQSMKR